MILMLWSVMKQTILGTLDAKNIQSLLFSLGQIAYFEKQ